MTYVTAVHLFNDAHSSYNIPPILFFWVGGVNLRVGDNQKDGFLLDCVISLGVVDTDSSRRVFYHNSELSLDCRDE